MKHPRISLVLSLLPAVALIACGEDSGPPKKDVVRPVIAMQVADVATVNRRWFPGRAAATRQVDLSFRLAGPLVSRAADVGDEVSKRDVLARLDPREFEIKIRDATAQLERARANLKAMQQARPEEVRQAKAAVQKAEAAFRLAVADFNRITSIKAEDPGAVSQALVDRTTGKKEAAEADLRRAKEELRIAQVGARAEDVAAQEAEIRSLRAAVDAAKDNLSYTYLRAPFTGTVVATYVENFEDVRAKQPIVRLIDASQIEMTVDIPESLISLAPYVDDVVVVFDAFPGQEIPAKVKEIGTEASETTRTYPITLIMNQPKDVKILSGMAGKAQARGELPVELREAGVEVPLSAIFSAGEPDKSYVWVIDEQTKIVSRRNVVTGNLTDRGIRVREGLEPGEWIATAGVHYLFEGQQVRILENRAG